MCTSLNTTFDWIGAVLINIGFIALITWGASAWWPLGFSLCALYTISLFGLSHWLERREDQATSEQEHEEIPVQEYGVVRDGKIISLRVSLLYGLAVVSLGVTGSLLPINLIKSCSSEYTSVTQPRYDPEYTWVTNITSLPKGVRNWAKSGNRRDFGAATFGYVVDTKTTLFEGTSSSRKSGYSKNLWTVKSTSPPQVHKHHFQPERFTVISSDTVCFTSLSLAPLVVTDTPSPVKESHIHCSDGNVFRSTIPAPHLYDGGYVYDFFVYDTYLWFKQMSSRSIYDEGLIFSLDTAKMNTALHSYKVKADTPLHSYKVKAGHRNCTYTQVIRKQVIAGLFVAALPTTLTSVALWEKKQIPSMAITTFVGFSLMFMLLRTAIDPNMRAWDRPVEWWFSITGLIWLLVLTYLNLSTAFNIQKPPLRWGLVISALAFLIGTANLLPMENDHFIDWFLLNLLIFVPLLLFGIVNSSMFVLFLGAVGLLVDSGRFAAYVRDHMQASDSEAPVVFLVFSLTGLAVGWIGFELSKHQHHIHDSAAKLIQIIDTVLAPTQDDPSVIEDHLSLLGSPGVDEATRYTSPVESKRL